MIIGTLMIIQFSVANVAGQASQFDVNTTFPASPNATNLGKYTDYALNNFSGVLPVTIPLLNYQNKDFSLPVSLFYDASGVKVQDIASNTGLGFILNCGGVITRQVRNVPDDGDRDKLGLSTGYLHYDFFRNFNNSTQDMALNLRDMSQGQSAYHLDSEPDIFSFNFLGKTGHFFLTSESTTINLVPYQNLKITFKTNEANRINEFDVVDEQGNTYVFADTEISNTTFVANADYTYPSGYFNNSGTSLTQDYIGAWYLSKITTYFGQVINFTYDTEHYAYGYLYNTASRHFTDSTKVITNGGVTTLDGCAMTQYDVNDYEPRSKISYQQSNMDVTGKRLKAIEGDNFKLTLDSGFNRIDLKNSYTIGNINYYSKYMDQFSNINYVLQNSWHLDYSYFQSALTDTHNGFFFSASSSSPGTDIFKRLRLDSITEISSTGLKKPPYIFDYYNDIPLPNRVSLKQDFFGYFNNNDCASMIPKMYVYPYNATQKQFSVYPLNTVIGGLSFVMPGADRTVNAAAIISGSMSKIHYPTGGFTQFIYEPKDFYYDGQNRLGGGLRIQQKIDYDGLSHSNDMIRNYRYRDSQDTTKSSGVIFDMPQYAYVENFPDYYEHPTTDVVPQHPYHITDYNLYEYNLNRLDHPQTYQTALDGAVVGYREVTEVNAGNGFITRRYSTPAPYGTLLVTNDDDNPNYCDLNDQGFCDNLFTAPKVEAALFPNDQYSTNANANVPPSLYTEGLYYDQYFNYPFAPSMNYDWNRGLLLSEKTYDNNGILKQQRKNTYQIFTPGTPYKIQYGVKYALMVNWKVQFSKYIISRPEYYAYSKYPIVTNIDKVLTKTENVTYLNGDSVKVISDYTYNNNKFPASRKIIGSDGKENEFYYKYPTDFPSDPVSQQLVNNYRIKPILQQIHQLQNQNIMTSTINYKDWGTNNYGVHTIEPESVVTQINGSSPVTESRNISLNLYGNPKELLKREVSSTANLWGTRINQHLVASATNATNNQIAYTSFEEPVDEDLPGNPYNWDVGSTLVSTDAKTGRYSCQIGGVPVYSTFLLPSGTYYITCWAKNGSPLIGGGTVLSTVNGTTDSNGWTFVKQKIQILTSGQLSVSSNNNSSLLIDELMLYPVNSLMTTYTYDPVLNILLSTSNSQGTVTSYEYDSFQRLVNIKDQNGNVVKHTDYHYRGQ